MLCALDDLALELQQGLEDTAYLAKVSRAVCRTARPLEAGDESGSAPSDGSTN